MNINEMRKQKNASRRFSLDLYTAKKAAGLTLNALGIKIGLSANQTKVLLDNPDKMTLKHLRDICNVLDVPAENFIQGYNLKGAEK